MTTKIKERPILMHARSINGILAGDKTQTRRIIKGIPPEYVRNEIVGPWCHFYDEPGEPNENGVRSGKMWTKKCPYGMPGDRLWVRETFRLGDEHDEFAPRQIEPHFHGYDTPVCWYVATDEALGPPGAGWGRKRASIHMPRWACRLVLEVVSVRVEQAHKIRSEDIRAEGVDDADWGIGRGGHVCSNVELRRRWIDLWDDTNGKGAWERNDWVWVVEFKVVE